MDSPQKNSTSKHFPSYNSFRQTCQPQIFSFPKSIMEYVWLYPRSTIAYLNTIKTCKLFFLKNPILIFPILRYTKADGWNYSLDSYLEKVHGGLQNINLETCESKIWISKTLRIFPDSSNIASGIIPKIYCCDIIILQLESQTISLNEFELLTASVTNELLMKQVTVENSDGTVVSIDELVGHLQNIVIFHYWFADTHAQLTSEGVKKLANFCCSKTKMFTLNNIFEGFDIDTFFCYLMENKNRTFIYLHFHQDISEAYQNRIYVVISKIFICEHCETREYLPPTFSFPNLDFELSLKISTIIEMEKQKYY